MQVKPMASPSAHTVGQTQSNGTVAQTLRRITMNTNATPGNYPDETAQDPAAIAADPAAQTTDPAKPATEDNQPLSPQLAALARQRRALQVKERELADKVKAFESQSAVAGDVINVADLKADKANIISVLLSKGFTFDDIRDSVLANQQSGYNPKISELEQKFKALEGSFEKKLTDRETQAEQAALSEMKRDATLLTAQGEDYALIRETGSIPKVMQLIEKTYRTTGEVMRVREALSLVEDDLNNTYLNIAKIGKVQSQLAPQAQPQTPPQMQRQMHTLTNRDTANATMGRKARALAAALGTLKK